MKIKIWIKTINILKMSIYIQTVLHLIDLISLENKLYFKKVNHIL